ncbi:MAG: zf-HC2 domain-containing protein [Candidatus Eisenbacteria bacterium]|nr:zf-HC2 domain-containing protein [Candidatus Eisenbacteria bacterium]
MKCKAARRRFSACVDRDLTFEEESQVREHLRECADCADQLERVERMVALLDSLPETDPGPGFYAAVQRRIREASPEMAGEGEPGTGFFHHLWERLTVPALRPAFGAAFLGLAVGIFAGVSGGPQVAQWIRGSQAPTQLASETGPSPASRLTLPETASRSPIADLDLSHLKALGDTVRLESDEFVLERYTADPQRGLIPAESDYGRQVSDEQSEVFITF